MPSAIVMISLYGFMQIIWILFLQHEAICESKTFYFTITGNVVTCNQTMTPVIILDNLLWTLQPSQFKKLGSASNMTLLNSKSFQLNCDISSPKIKHNWQKYKNILVMHLSYILKFKYSILINLGQILQRYICPAVPSKSTQWESGVYVPLLTLPTKIWQWH